MRRLGEASNTTCLMLHSLQGAWNTVQSKAADTLRWRTAQRVQARAWLSAVNCSARESAKRLLSVAERR